MLFCLFSPKFFLCKSPKIKSFQFKINMKNSWSSKKFRYMINMDWYTTHTKLFIVLSSCIVEITYNICFVCASLSISGQGNPVLTSAWILVMPGRELWRRRAWRLRRWWRIRRPRTDNSGRGAEPTDDPPS